MRNFVSEGKCVTIRVNPNDHEVMSGDPLLMSSLFGIAATSLLKVDPCFPLGSPEEERSIELYVEGVFELKSDESQFKVGDKVYFDPTRKLVTAKADGAVLIGAATENIKRSDSLLRVRLNGVSI